MLLLRFKRKLVKSRCNGSAMAFKFTVAEPLKLPLRSCL